MRGVHIGYDTARSTLLLLRQMEQNVAAAAAAAATESAAVAVAATRKAGSSNSSIRSVKTQVVHIQIIPTFLDNNIVVLSVRCPLPRTRPLGCPHCCCSFIVAVTTTNQPRRRLAIADLFAAGCVRCCAHQTLQQHIGFGEVNTAQAEYDRLADEMWKAQVGGRALSPATCHHTWLL